MSKPPPSDHARFPADGGSTEIVARRLALHSRLDSTIGGDLERLLGRPIRFEAGALIAEFGDDADLVTVLQDGLACRMNLLPDGRRQIHALTVPGDAADAETPLLHRRSDNIQALTRCMVWRAPKSRFEALTGSRPRLAEAFAREAAIGAQVAREWVVNVGRRTALERIAHLICELYLRLDAVSRVEEDGFDQPLTQQDIADAQGISAVHVNRVLQELRGRGLIRTGRRRLTVLDLAQLQAVGLFDPLYLQLGSLAPDSPM